MSRNQAVDRAGAGSVERYEAAHARLLAALAERTGRLSRLPDAGHPTSAEQAVQRAIVLERGLQLLAPLRRFVRRELDLRQAGWLLERNEFSVDDIVAGTFAAALEQAETAPADGGLYRWLRRLARREVRRTVAAVRQHDRHEVSLETPLATIGEDWPDRVLRLKDVLADPTATLPEEVVEHEETSRVLEEVLARLPERWREVFLLHAVDGWPEEEIASAEGLEPASVSWISQASRAFVREWLESDHLFEEA